MYAKGLLLIVLFILSFIVDLYILFINFSSVAALWQLYDYTIASKLTVKDMGAWRIYLFICKMQVKLLVRMKFLLYDKSNETHTTFTVEEHFDPRDNSW